MQAAGCGATSIGQDMMKTRNIEIPAVLWAVNATARLGCVAHSRLRRFGIFLLFALMLPAWNANAFEVQVRNDFNPQNTIDAVLMVRWHCEKNFGQTREYGGWTMTNKDTGAKVGEYYFDNGNWEAWNDSKYKVDSFAEPGGNYEVAGYCVGSTMIGIRETAGATKSFSILPLTGKSQLAQDNSKVTISGTIGGGANGVLIIEELADRDLMLAVVKNLTSAYSVDLDLAPGSHKLRVYADYDDKFSHLIDTYSVTVHGPPKIETQGIPEFSKDPNITIAGTASSTAKIKSAWYEWQVPGGMGGRGYLSITPGEETSLNPRIAMSPDGKHRFRFLAEAEDGQKTFGEWVSTTLDRKNPVFENKTVAEEGFIGPDAILRVNVKDPYPNGSKDASGVEDVQMRATDKNGKTYGWQVLTRQNGTIYDGDYTLALGDLFRQLPAGDVTISVWAKDKAGNEDYAPDVVYKKAGQPIASVTVSAPVTNEDSIDLAIKANGETKIGKIWLDAWTVDKDGKMIASVKRMELAFAGGKNVDFHHRFIFPRRDGKYAFSVTAEGIDEQRSDAAVQVPAYAIFDTAPPTVELLSTWPGSSHETELDFRFKAEDKNGSGVDGMKIMMCQEKVFGVRDCGEEKSLADIGEGHYEEMLRLAGLAPGEFSVRVFVKDKAGNGAQIDFYFVKELKVGDALDLMLELADRPGEAGEDAVAARQTPLLYRVVLTSRQQPLDALSLTYNLPGGLQTSGKPVLVNAAGNALVNLNPQWDGDADTELLAPGAALGRNQRIAIDIPVMIKDIVDDGVVVQSTVGAGAANLAGALRKSHKLRTLERETAGDRVRVVKSMDADAVVQPGAQIRYRIRVSNHTSKTVRNLLIRDRAPDHTALLEADCGNLPASACKVLTLGDNAVANGNMTHAALCTGAGPQSDPQGRHVFWCLNDDLEPLADTSVNYSVQINGAAPAAPTSPQ